MSDAIEEEFLRRYEAMSREDTLNFIKALQRATGKRPDGEEIAGEAVIGFTEIVAGGKIPTLGITVYGEDGRKLHIYPYARMSAGACAILIAGEDDDPHILMGVKKGEWALPGGFLTARSAHGDDGKYDKTLEATAKRETREETKLDIEKLPLELVKHYMEEGNRQTADFQHRPPA